MFRLNREYVKLNKERSCSITQLNSMYKYNASKLWSRLSMRYQYGIDKMTIRKYLRDSVLEFKLRGQ